MRIYLIGFMGSGKSTVGQKHKLNQMYSFIDIDGVLGKEAWMIVSSIFNE